MSDDAANAAALAKMLNILQRIDPESVKRLLEALQIFFDRPEAP